MAGSGRTDERRPWPDWWVWLLLALAALKIALALVALLSGAGDPPPSVFPPWIGIAHILIYGGAGAVLIALGREPRALDLGAYFLIFASSFSDRFIEQFPIGSPAAVLLGLHPDAFLPLLLWRFIRGFPEGVGASRGDRLARGFIGASAAAGLLLFAANVGMLVRAPAGESPLGYLARSGLSSQYWTVNITLTLAALLFAAWKMRMARPAERRRVRLFLTGLIVGSLPVLVDVLLESLVPSFRRLMSEPGARRIGGMVVYPFLLSIPVTTAYAVLVQHVLDVRLVVRRAMQYALGRYSVLGLIAIPFVVLGFYLFQHRDLPLRDVFTGPRVLVLAGLATAALWMARLRRSLYDTLDRRFFREQHDARAILNDLVDRSRGAASAEELGHLLQSEIDRALHLQNVEVFLAQPTRGHYEDLRKRLPPLGASSRLASWLSGAPEPLDVDLEVRPSPWHRLPSAEVEWLSACGFRLIVPLLGTGDALLGFVALGDKRSELPFSSEDRLLLSAIAASGAMTLENRLLRSTPGLAAPTPRVRATGPQDPAADEPAHECTLCHVISAATEARCPACAGPVQGAPVPRVLAGKFAIEQRIGSGGMGIVYRGLDLELRRAVAVKTLPQLSPEASARMRREARAVARLMHPNMATIFGVEMWRGAPMLIFEFIEGGTLADRLAGGPMSPRAVVDLGLVLADVLQQAHDAGVLHRDVKPSNIGFTRQGAPKLLDFGLAHLLTGAVVHGVTADSRSDARTTSLVLAPHPSGDARILGTPLYLSPEAVAGQPPDPAFDLWSVAMVLYEAVAGRHPVSGRSIFETLDLISRCAIPPVQALAPDCPAALAGFLETALAIDPAVRPATAREMASRLRAVGHALS